ncbi:BspA family leucine-rich repeat surface protein [Enterococcus mundtii]|uniref:BspA family leucine-rich repeat surface protein n=1 Tax=Enterococcus mundtii TaxID=53346 RepID=UPI000E01B764|nr:BspA family leucine-rich repeat surface protein [Enterococcus mundtii]STD21703.1 cell wall anchor domain-containing protein [Enterococcus mundtii]
MKRKTLIVVILAVLSIPANISYAVENEALFEDTIDSEVLDEIQDDQLEDIESSVEIGTESGLEEALEEVKESDEPTVSEAVDEEVKEDSIEGTNIQNREVDVVASGKNTGGMNWVLYSDGVLEIGGGSWALRNTNWDNYRAQISTVRIIDTINPDSTGGFALLFSGLSNLLNIEGLEKLNTNDCTSFSSMFYGCSSLQFIDLSSFNTEKVLYMKKMFTGCSSLEEINLESFDTKNVTDMSDMFRGCYKLRELSLSNFNTEKATDMSGMFGYCLNLENINLSSFNTKNVTTMYFMFAHCRKLERLDLSNFDTSNVTNMSNMFFYTWSLIELNLSSFDVRKVSNFDAFLEQAKSIKELDLNNFVTESCTTAIGTFKDMDSLEVLHIPQWSTVKTTDTKHFFNNSPLKKISIGENFKMTSYMSLRNLSSDEVWVDVDKEELSTESLIDYHNDDSKSNTYHVEKQYTLTFDTNGGTEISKQKSIAGKTWSIPEAPEKNGFIFDYWSIDQEGNTPYDFTKPVTSSLTLYGQYSPAYIVSIPASINLNETNQLQVYAENYQEGKSLIISTDEKIALVNTGNPTYIIEKEITKEKKYADSTHVLEMSGVEKSKNTLFIQSLEDEKHAGTYEGNLNFTVEFY